jgi:hypothetical protein
MLPHSGTNNIDLPNVYLLVHGTMLCLKRNQRVLLGWMPSILALVVTPYPMIP